MKIKCAENSNEHHNHSDRKSDSNQRNERQLRATKATWRCALIPKLVLLFWAWLQCRDTLRRHLIPQIKPHRPSHPIYPVQSQPDWTRNPKRFEIDSEPETILDPLGSPDDAARTRNPRGFMAMSLSTDRTLKPAPSLWYELGSDRHLSCFCDFDFCAVDALPLPLFVC